jgi:hypothetical protein
VDCLNFTPIHQRRKVLLEELIIIRNGGRRPFGRPNCKWKDNIKMDLKEIEYEGVE